MTPSLTDAYRRPRASFRRFLEGGATEPRLLAFAFVAGLAGFVAGLLAGQGRLPGTEAAAAETDDAVAAVIFARLFAATFLAPLLFYALAALSHLLARPFGAAGSFFAARAALFWTLLLISPLMVLEGALRPFLGSGAGPALSGAGLFLAFAWLWSQTLSEAEGFGRAKWVFAAIVTPFAAIWISFFLV